jgi:hypothetical protein
MQVVDALEREDSRIAERVNRKMTDTEKVDRLYDLLCVVIASLPDNCLMKEGLREEIRVLKENW